VVAVGVIIGGCVDVGVIVGGVVVGGVVDGGVPCTAWFLAPMATG
jgi:hypothetical protein